MIEFIEPYTGVLFLALVASWLFGQSHHKGEMPMVFTVIGLGVFLCSVAALLVLMLSLLFA